MKNQKIAIIGGGITGLVTGYELTKRGYKVAVFEKEKELGGLAGCFKLGNKYLEKTYHHIFEIDKEIIDLAGKLGLQDKIIWKKDSTAIYFEGKIYPFVSPIDLLKFTPLGLIDKIRLGLTGLYLQKENNWQKFVSIPAYKWMRGWCGKRAYEVIWEPLLRGKFGDSYKEISMAWMWARIHTRGISKNLGYFDGSLQILIDKLSEEIKKQGGEIKLNFEARETELTKKFDVVVSTAPFTNIKYLGAITVVFTSEQNLSKYYWHNINDLDSPFLAFIQHSNFINGYEQNIYYLGSYLPHEHRYFKENEEMIYRDWFNYLKKIFPNFDQKKITSKFIFKLKNAQHVVTTDYIIPEKKKNNLYTINFAGIFPEDRGINFAVREGRQVAEMVIKNQVAF